MSVVDLIRKKRDGGELSREEIERLIRGCTSGDIPDYQLSAWLMAVFFRGMTPRETADLTMAMVDSGRRVDLSGIPGRKADKHSTGGVGDKTTLVLAPLAAAAGLPVAKLSGRGLGHTGGTLDKLESIPGFNVNLDLAAFAGQVARIGLAIAGQTSDLVPADGKLYALRDVTATVESVPLIAASVMSKKIAGGAEVIVLDVKAGRGAFMNSLEEARALAGAMIAIGEALGRRVGAVVSAMDQPLGRAVGNALEVREALETLEGRGPADLRELALELGAWMLRLAGLAAGLAEARRRLASLLEGGAARRKLAEMVAAQGGDTAALEDPSRLPQAPVVRTLAAPAAGFVQAVDALAVAETVVSLGGGRRVKGQAVDHAVGVVLGKKAGEAVDRGEPLAFVHARDEAAADAALHRLAAAFALGEERPSSAPLIRGVLMPADLQKSHTSPQEKGFLQ